MAARHERFMYDHWIKIDYHENQIMPFGFINKRLYSDQLKLVDKNKSCDGSHNIM